VENRYRAITPKAALEGKKRPHGYHCRQKQTALEETNAHHQKRTSPPSSCSDLD
jgi:sugar-specific transcriptional regulator TrmB